MAHALLTALCDAFGKVRRQGEVWVGREARSMESTSWFLWLAAGGGWICYSAISTVLDTFPQGAGTADGGTKHFPLVGPGSLVKH